MNREASINVAEKQRLRDSIAEQIQRYLDSGGNITVLDTPRTGAQPPRGQSWRSDIEFEPGSPMDEV